MKKSLLFILMTLLPMSTYALELINYCSWTFTTQNGVSGYKVTGANGNSIFLPAGGVKQYGIQYFTDRSCVMSASLFSDCISASVLCCENGTPHYWYIWDRCWGYNVRPVTSVAPSGMVSPSIVDDQTVVAIYNLQGHKLD